MLIFTRRMVVLLMLGCLAFFMLIRVKLPEKLPGILPGTLPGILETNTTMLKTIMFASPKYGLDFKLEYSLANESKARVAKSDIFPPNQTHGAGCVKTITLDRIDRAPSISSGLFFIEASGRETITARQACAVESAAGQSGLSVILVMTATQLDLSDNTTCYLYMHKNKVKFYTVDVMEFSLNSPLENFFKSDVLAGSSHQAVHTADALRLLIIYKFGGFYLDLDYVVLRDLSHYKNMLVSEGDSPEEVIDTTNSVFMFSANHSVLLAAMQDIEQGYDPACWACIGPGLLTEAARKIINGTRIQDIPASVSLNVTLIQRFYAMPFESAAGLLFPDQPVSFTSWETLFENSSAVHFFSGMTSHIVAQDDPQYSAYALLGPRYCPYAYYSSNEF